MKMIAAFIRPKKWSAVQEALGQIEVDRMTVADALGFADTPATGEKTIPKTLAQYVFLEIIVNDDFLERTVEMISKVARTGNEGLIGDGKIFVLPVDDVVRIHDGFHGKGAV